MAALVQSYTQPAGTITLLPSRPMSASGMLPTQPQPPQQFSYAAPRNNNHHHHGGMQGNPPRPGPYRSSPAPVQPYAFTATPNLNQDRQWQQSRTSRTSSMPSVPTIQNIDPEYNSSRPRYPASASVTNLPGNNSGVVFSAGSRDDSVLPASGSRRPSASPRPQSSHMATSSSPTTLGVPPTATSTRVSPERYRRTASRSADQSPVSSSAGSPNPGVAAYNYHHRSPTDPSHAASRGMRAASGSGRVADNLHLNEGPVREEGLRSRRRSLPALDSASLPKFTAAHDGRASSSDSAARGDDMLRPKSAGKDQISPRLNSGHAGPDGRHIHSRKGSADSRVSSPGSNPRSSSSANRNVYAPTGNPALLSSVDADQAKHNQDYHLVNIPPRSSSSDAATTKRVPNPSPLSRPVNMDTESEAASNAHAADGSSVPPASLPHRIESAAVKHLSAINEKSGRLRSKTSRLRRAFSFGSAADFKKAAGPDFDPPREDTDDSSPAKLQKDPTTDEAYDAEQARIAQKQEAAGLGNNIYGPGKIFSVSTDNISVSSTASSASIMIRKMGRGMKKGSRSLAGLFRPKSIIDAPTSEAIVPEASEATVSMVTAEAEHQRINVNPDPHAQQGGGTGFPRLERNSMDATKSPRASSERVGSSGTDDSANRKSIVGSDSDRAEVLAAVRKGILKRSSSPRSSDGPPGQVADLIPNVPQITESPNSSAPSTPNEDAHGHRRTGSVAIGNEDYFVSALRLRQDTKSAPGTPQGSKRNATFSPRIMFYDTWPSGEYDRRGEVATCNRLTPMLAQQIKEELNNFKMEMEVHENSKIYTHFF